MLREEKEEMIKETMADITAAGYKQLMLSPREVAQITGVSISTLDNWRRAGVGIPFKKMDRGRRGRVMYPKRSVAEWIISGNVRVA